MMSKIAIIIPTYNECSDITRVLDDLYAVINTSRADYEYDIFVYDNNSSDGTDLIVDGYIAHYKLDNLHTAFVFNKGKGNVMRQAFNDLAGLYSAYIMVDGDNTYDVKNLTTMVDLVLMHKFDVVYGDRLSTTYRTENKKRIHELGNDFTLNLTNRLYGANLADVLTGYRAFSDRFVFDATPYIVANGFNIEANLNHLALSGGFAVCSTRVGYKDRINSESKIRPISDGIKIITSILKYRLFYRVYNSRWASIHKGSRTEHSFNSAKDLVEQGIIANKDGIYEKN